MSVASNRKSQSYVHPNRIYLQQETMTCYLEGIRFDVQRHCRQYKINGYTRNMWGKQGIVNDDQYKHTITALDRKQQHVNRILGTYLERMNQGDGSRAGTANKNRMISYGGNQSSQLRNTRDINEHRTLIQRPNTVAGVNTRKAPQQAGRQSTTKSEYPYTKQGSRTSFYTGRATPNEIKSQQTQSNAAVVEAFDKAINCKEIKSDRLRRGLTSNELTLKVNLKETVGSKRFKKRNELLRQRYKDFYEHRNVEGLSQSAPPNIERQFDSVLLEEREELET